jgi:mono/diheme cytochrome c family protein
MWLMLSACERAPEPSSSPLARERGRVLFRAHCVLCHGPGADGMGVRAFGLDRAPADFTSAAWRGNATVARVRAAIRDGVPGTPMPAWPTFSPDEIDELTAYVMSVHEHGP